MNPMTDDDYIRALIAEGEHRQQDFKFEISDARKIARTLSAFANTAGGRLLIGVKDNGRIAGVRSEEEAYMIEAAARLYCSPEVEYTLTTHRAEGRIVLVAEVAESASKPVYARDESGKGWAYVRVADENILATRVHIRVWKQAARPLGELVEFSDRERFLLDFLRENEYITFNQYCRKGRISRREAEVLLARFIRFGIAEPCFIEHNFCFRLCRSDVSDV